MCPFLMFSTLLICKSVQLEVQNISGVLDEIFETFTCYQVYSFMLHMLQLNLSLGLLICSVGSKRC